ncbi:MAG: hypothetical protein AAGM22_30700 [Acidobacteriota bacterium]
MPTKLGALTVLILAVVLAAAAMNLDGQPQAGSATTPNLEALKTMAPEDRYSAIRAMDRDDRVAVLNSMDRSERKAYRAFSRDRRVEEQGYQALPEPRRVDDRQAKVAGTTIQYDSGVVTGTFTAAALGRFVGNRYSSALNGAGTALVPVEQTGTITMLTFDMVRTFFSTVTWSLYSDIMGTSAVQVDSVIIPVAPGLNSFTVNPTVTDNVYQNGPFLAGIWQFNVMSTAIGVDTNSVGGQGLNLVTINEPQTVAPNTGMGLTDVGGRNAVFRIGGNLVTPVELVDFKIE